MPVRFTSPSLGENTSPQLKKHQWQVDVAYRHLHASQWFVGTEVRESAAPFQQPLYLNIDSFDITATTESAIESLSRLHFLSHAARTRASIRTEPDTLSNQPVSGTSAQ